MSFSLVGNELLAVEGIAAEGGPSGGLFVTTTQAIANLAGGGGGLVSPVTINQPGATGPALIQSSDSNLAIAGAGGDRIVQFIDGTNGSGTMAGTFLQMKSGDVGVPFAITGSGSDTTHALNINSLQVLLNAGTI